MRYDDIYIIFFMYIAMYKIDYLYNKRIRFTKGEDLMPTVLFNKDASRAVSYFIRHSNDFL